MVAFLKVHVIPPQVAPRRDTPSRSLGHDQREFQQRVNLIRYCQQSEIDIVQHHRPLRILLAWEADAVERVFLQESPPVLSPFPRGPIERRHQDHEIRCDRLIPDHFSRLNAEERADSLPPG